MCINLKRKGGSKKNLKNAYYHVSIQDMNNAFFFLNKKKINKRIGNADGRKCMGGGLRFFFFFSVKKKRFENCIE